jgi:hypothetical protein
MGKKNIEMQTVKQTFISSSSSEQLEVLYWTGNRCYGQMIAARNYVLKLSNTFYFSLCARALRVQWNCVKNCTSFLRLVNGSSSSSIGAS